MEIGKWSWPGKKVWRAPACREALEPVCPQSLPAKCEIGGQKRKKLEICHLRFSGVSKEKS